MSKKGLTIQIDKDDKLSQLRFNLNLRQRHFCEIYSSDQEFFCNGVMSYCEAYSFEPKSKKDYNVASSAAHTLLKKVEIQEYIDALIVDSGLNENFIDKQLNKVITQDYDLKSKVSAIKEANKLKGRIIAKAEVKHEGNITIGVVLARIQNKNQAFREGEIVKEEVVEEKIEQLEATDNKVGDVAIDNLISKVKGHDIKKVKTQS